MKYFSGCSNIDEVKKLYKELAKANHPDMGGSTAVMQEINNEYTFATAKILKGESLDDVKIEEELRFSEEYREVIEKIIHLQGIIIELVGRWIWVSGDTRPVKTELSEAGLIFHGAKKMWFYRSTFLQKKHRGHKMEMDEIRNKYGSELINKGFRKAIK